MSYGYIGDTSTSIKQQVKNAGVLSMNDVLDLEGKGQLGGSLELIQSQSVSGATTCNFTSIQQEKYDVHLLQLDDLESGSGMYSEIRLSNDGGSSFETSNYQRAVQYGGTQGSFGANQSTSADRFTILNISNANEPQSLYVYLYNLGSSSKYSLITHHAPPSNIYMYYGGGVYAVAETINAIQILNSAGASFTGGTAKLYGVKQI